MLFLMLFIVCVFQVAELEAQLGRPAAGQPGKEELSRSLEELEALLRAKDQARHQISSQQCTLSKSICHFKGKLGLYH